MKIKIATVAMLLAFAPLHAEEQAPDPIDVKLNASIDKNFSTRGMVVAYSAAREAWKKDIQSSLAAMKYFMSPEEVDSIVTSQKAWEVFFSTETATLSKIHSSMKGTMWGVGSVVHEMNLYKERALSLRRCLETLSRREAQIDN